MELIADRNRQKYLVLESVVMKKVIELPNKIIQILPFHL